ncbi:MAG: hypothetical protein HYY19_07905 [Candidatus Rokubacteria bacterium]|nr:hypothetical protein [Candidatus Rokubacteria bacterium]
MLVAEEEIRELMGKLMKAIEASLAASEAVREALQEIVRQGYEAKLFFVANAERSEEGEGEAEEATERDWGALTEGELRFELTKLDKDFLKSLHIRPDAS